MCAIVGLYNLGSKSAGPLGNLVEAMAGSVAHRGPDGAGVWTSPDGSVTLGHRRLSILDLSELGRQPMGSPSGLVVTYNGEIYNYRELQRQFDPSTFRSTSDTEVLLRLYERDAEDSLAQLNGIFAFGMYDPARQRL